LIVRQWTGICRVIYRRSYTRRPGPGLGSGAIDDSPPAKPCLAPVQDLGPTHLVVVDSA